MTDRSFERKFVGGRALAPFASAWLAHVCEPAPDYADEVIHSVYYDTPDLRCYGEKVNGDFLKTKVRLRWYEERLGVHCPHPGPLPGGEGEGRGRSVTVGAFLEVKRKEGGSRGKKRLKVHVDGGWLESADLRDGRFIDLLQAHAQIGEAPPIGLVPSVHIRYRRQRFVCVGSGSGVSLDTGIGAERVNSTLIPGIGCVNIPFIVLEIKGASRGAVPWLARLYEAGFRSRSFSKYGECVSRLIGEEA